MIPRIPNYAYNSVNIPELSGGVNKNDEGTKLDDNQLCDAFNVGNDNDDHAPLDVVHDVLDDTVELRLVLRIEALGISFEKELKIEETCLKRASLHLVIVIVKSADVIAVISDHVTERTAGHKSNLALLLAGLCLGEHSAVCIHDQHDIVPLLGNVLPDKHLLASGRSFPVDILDIVSGHVLTELIEIHTSSLINGIVRTVENSARSFVRSYRLITLEPELDL